MTDSSPHGTRPSFDGCPMTRVCVHHVPEHPSTFSPVRTPARGEEIVSSAGQAGEARLSCRRPKPAGKPIGNEADRSKRALGKAQADRGAGAAGAAGASPGGDAGLADLGRHRADGRRFRPQIPPPQPPLAPPPRSPPPPHTPPPRHPTN